MKKPILLCRLTTRDGIVSPIEVMDEFRYREHRSAPERMKVYKVMELTELEGDTTAQSRTYIMKEQVPAILIEMEEE